MKQLRRVRTLTVRMIPGSFQAAGFALLTYAAWELERVAGIVVAGVVLLLYGRYSGR